MPWWAFWCLIAVYGVLLSLAWFEADVAIACVAAFLAFCQLVDLLEGRVIWSER